MPNQLTSPDLSSLLKLSHDPTVTIQGDPMGDVGDNPYGDMTDELIFGAVNTLLGWIDDATGLDLEDMADPLEALLGTSTGLLSGLVGFLNPSSSTTGGGVLGPLLNLIPGLGGGTGTLGGLGSFLNPTDLTSAAGILAPLTGLLGGFNLSGVPILSQLITAGGGSGSTLTDFEGLFTAIGTDFEAIVEGIFGISGGDETTLDTAGSNLMKLLGNPNLNPSGIFDEIEQAGQFLQNVLTPAGALSTATPIPTHLFGGLNTGSAGDNVLPDPSFDDPSNLDGIGLWDWSSVGRTRPGSAHTAANGTLRPMIGVPQPVVPGDIVNLGAYLKWVGTVVTAGQAILLCCNAYDATDTLISDPNRVIASVTAPGTTSIGYTGADGSGWVNLTGSYQVPAGTAYVRLDVDVAAVVISGDVYVDDCLMQIQTGLLDANLLKNTDNVNFQWLPTSVGGFQGLTDMLATFGHYTDGLGSAFTQSGGLSDISLPDLFGLAQTQTNNATTANFQAALHTLILGNRTNKSAGFGANSTTQGSLTVDAYSSAGTLTTTTIAAGTSVGHRYTVPEFATYGFLNLQLSIPSGAGNHLFVNIYKIDPVTNAKTALFNSPDEIGLVGTTNAIVRVLLPGMPQVQASDELLFEIVNASTTNAITTVFKATGIPNDPNELLSNTGWTRTNSAGGTSPTSLTSGQGSYSGNIPYAMIGIQDVPANYQPPQTTPYPASGHYTWIPPVWQAVGDIVDLVGCGAGGGGGGSVNWIPGEGGSQGLWNGIHLIVGTTIKLGTTVDVVVGTEGSGGSVLAGNGTAGTATVFTYTDPSNTTHTVTCAGGAGGSAGGVSTGSTGSGPFTFDLIQYFGGAGVGANAHGIAPGGGGGGGISYTGGATGSDGGGFVRAAQP